MNETVIASTVRCVGCATPLSHAFGCPHEECPHRDTSKASRFAVIAQIKTEAGEIRRGLRMLEDAKEIVIGDEIARALEVLARDLESDA